MEGALRIAIVGAESTGKTTLAAALAAHLTQTTKQRVVWVPEVLREWCDRAGRTPRADEQAAILQAQQDRIDAAAAAHDIVVCDTTPLMTAVYSRLVFGDCWLDTRAAEWHRHIDLTLLTALDLPWVADGLQRVGPQVREPVDSALRELMAAHGLPWTVVRGEGSARLQCAVAAVAAIAPPRWPAAGRAAA